MTARPSAKVANVQIPLKISTAFFSVSKWTITVRKMANRMYGLKSYYNIIKWRMFTFTSLSIVVANVSKSTRTSEWSSGIAAFRIRFVSTGMASGSTLVDIWMVRSNANIGVQTIQIRGTVTALGHAAKSLRRLWPLQLYIFDLCYWQAKTPYSHFLFYPQGFLNVYRRNVGTTWRNLSAINLNRNNSILWKYYFSFVSSFVCPAGFLAWLGFYRLTWSQWISPTSWHTIV